MGSPLKVYLFPSLLHLTVPSGAPWKTIWNGDHLIVFHWKTSGVFSSASKSSRDSKSKQGSGTPRSTIQFNTLIFTNIVRFYPLKSFSSITFLFSCSVGTCTAPLWSFPSTCSVRAELRKLLHPEVNEFLQPAFSQSVQNIDVPSNLSQWLLSSHFCWNVRFCSALSEFTAAVSVALSLSLFVLTCPNVSRPWPLINIFCFFFGGMLFVVPRTRIENETAKLARQRERYPDQSGSREMGSNSQWNVLSIDLLNRLKLAMRLKFCHNRPPEFFLNDLNLRQQKKNGNAFADLVKKRSDRGPIRPDKFRSSEIFIRQCPKGRP